MAATQRTTLLKSTVTVSYKKSIEIARLKLMLKVVTVSQEVSSVQLSHSD